jgi:hypothetical protein
MPIAALKTAKKQNRYAMTVAAVYFISTAIIHIDSFFQSWHGSEMIFQYKMSGMTKRVCTDYKLFLNNHPSL